MLTLLRKIRRSLIASGSARKYVIYAIGEIALVVIGILIALQINNWNEERKKETQIETYLISLIEALQDDINFLNYTIQGNDFRANCIKRLIQWSDGIRLRSIPETQYTVDEGWDSGSLNVGWTNRWMESIPNEFDQSFVEECFFRTSYGNIIVTNHFTLDEFKNSGLFSSIRSEELRKQINHYYAIINWQFSIWRETNYRQKIDAWESFLRDSHQTNYSDISHLSDPIGFIRDHRDVQLELESLCIDAAGRVNSAGEIRDAAKALIQSINNYIQLK